MTDFPVYTFDEYKEKYHTKLEEVYNDFKTKAETDYKFEVLPIDYENFVNSVKSNLIKCIILFVKDTPAGFLVYTTNATDSVELNIIHIINGDNSIQKRAALLKKFSDEIELSKNTKIISYPVLGIQKEILDYLYKFNFKTVNQSIMALDLDNRDTLVFYEKNSIKPLKHGYSVVNWNEEYTLDAVKIIHESFKNTSDSKYDSRFLTLKGTSDVILKITQGMYGEFLPDITKVLIYHGKIAGICFANLTNKNKANIPLVAVKSNFRGKSFGKFLLKAVVSDLIKKVFSENSELKEINATCDKDNTAAYNMYLGAGFKEVYSYKHAYKD